MKRMLYYILLPLVLITLSIVLFMNFSPQFGGTSKGDYKAKLEASPQYQNGKFVNQIETNMNTGEESMFKTMMQFIRGVDHAKPEAPVKVKALDTVFDGNSKQLSMTWLGHSTLLIQMDGVKMLTDPVFSKRTSPVSFAGTKAFEYMPNYQLEDLPELDYVLISHDHYDHLDYKTIDYLKNKVKAFVVPLGVAAHLVRWGVIEEKIIELDWYDEAKLDGIKLTSTPARHFSGRGLTNRNSTLWCSYVIQGTSQSVFFSGDSGYGPHFKEIGEKYGPFDYCFMECGQYNPNWADIHMSPEQSAQAFVDLNGKNLIPIHWAKFALALHTWTEPVERITKKADELNIKVSLPPVGALVNDKTVGSYTERWWNE